MKTSLIRIGNSRGIRIPKLLLEESGLTDAVELKVKKGEIKIVKDTSPSTIPNETYLLSQSALAQDWNRPEEDEAWADL